MRFNLITNLTNGVGLERDYRLLKAELETLGHQVNGVQFNGNQSPPEADVNIFLEVVERRFLGPRNWIIPNAEWWYGPHWDQLLPRFELVLAKTRHCESLFRTKAKTRYIGWCSQDLRDETVERKPKFLHVAGKSQTKNTLAVIETWKQRKPWAELTIVSEYFRYSGIAKVTCHGRLEEAELKRLMNAHRFHLMPSQYEGWGHSLHEGLGVGAVILTTDAAPMNESAGIDREMLIRPCSHSQQNAAPLYQINTSDTWDAINRALKTGPRDWRLIGDKARNAFEQETAEFKAAIRELVGEA